MRGPATRARASPRLAHARARELPATPAAPPIPRAGREALIPLTPSLFVPATLGGSAEVLVDIGTGFFVGKPAAAAVDLLRARADAVGGEVGGLARVLSIKESNRDIIAQHISMLESANGGGGGGGGGPAPSS